MTSTRVNSATADWTAGSPLYGEDSIYQGRELVHLKILSDRRAEGGGIAYLARDTPRWLSRTRRRPSPWPTASACGTGTQARRKEWATRCPVIPRRGHNSALLQQGRRISRATEGRSVPRRNECACPGT